METTTKIITSVTLLAMLTIILTVPGLVDKENVHVCLEPEMAMQCDSLSKINAEGLITRCYYNSPELNRTTYKNCKTGWLEYTPQEQVIKKDLGNMSRCLVIKGNDLVKECVVEGNKTEFYIIRLS